MLATSVVLVVLLLGGAQSQTEDTKTAEKIDTTTVTVGQDVVTKQEPVQNKVIGNETTDAEGEQNVDAGNRTLYFLIDGSISVKYYEFCRLITTAQLLVAAFNPSSSETTGPKFSARLFSAPGVDPQEVFATSDDCQDIVTNQLPLVIAEYRRCKSERIVSSTTYPPLCKPGTYAIEGLKQIADDAEKRGDQLKALVLLTDGIIDPRAGRNENLVTALNNLRNAVNRLDEAGVTVRITAQSQNVYTPALLDYTSTNVSTLGNSNPLHLSLEIINRLNAEGFISDDDANSVSNSIKEASVDPSIYFYCTCMEDTTGGPCKLFPGIPPINVIYTFPICGGALDFGISRAVGT